MKLGTDLSVFYDTDQFAVPCVAQAGESEVEFAAVLGAVDETVHFSEATATVRRLRHIAAQVMLQQQQQLLVDGVPYVVMQPSQLIVDGLEAEAVVSPIHS